MPLEPNEKIEELLKRYIEQRKRESQADFELHPATRNLLQGEVARTFAQKKSRFVLFWPRLAIVGAFTTLLVISLAVLNAPRHRPMELVQSSAKESVAAPAESLGVKQEKLLPDSSRDRNDFAKSEMPAPAAPPQRRAGEPDVAGRSGAAEVETRFKDKSAEPADQLNDAKQKAELSVDETATARTVAPKTFARSASDSSVVETGTSSLKYDVPAMPPATAYYAAEEPQKRWQFRQQDLRANYRKNLLSPAQPKILQSFEFIRNGNKVRLIDEDGSIYEGDILEAADAAGGNAARSEMKKSSAFSFQAAGTNQQLNRIVGVSGEYFAETFNREEKTPVKKNDATPLGAIAKLSEPTPGRIEGKVSIGGTNEFQIRATTELPK